MEIYSMRDLMINNENLNNNESYGQHKEPLSKNINLISAENKN